MCFGTRITTNCGMNEKKQENGNRLLDVGAACLVLINSFIKLRTVQCRWFSKTFEKFKLFL